LHIKQRFSRVSSVGTRRTFGTTRKHRSGRWGAEYTHPVSRERVLPGKSFATKADALRWLAEAEVDLDRGQLLDPSGAKQTFESYATSWLDGRNDLRPKTLDLYDYLLRLYLLPDLGNIVLSKIDSSTVRRWHGHVSAGTQSSVTTAKAYRLLRQILEAAVDDMFLRSNPCTLKNVAVERSAERSTPTVDEAIRLVEAVKPEYRLMVLLAAVAGLRRGECFALRRRDLIEVGGVWSVNINASVVFVKDVAIHQAPKTTAGVRRLTLPAVVAQAIVEHLDAYGPFSPDDFLFVDRRTGITPTKTVWRRVWSNAQRDADVDYTFHDLRHLAGTLNATAGASIRESMARMGHSSPRAALRYQHLVELRDAEVASSIDRLLR
jgi:integrase